MPYCNNCGRQINQDDKFCHNCSYDLQSSKKGKRYTGNIPSIIVTSILAFWVVFQTFYNYTDGRKGGFSGLFAILLFAGLIWMLVKPSHMNTVCLLSLSSVVTLVSMFILLGYVFDVEASTSVKCITVIEVILGTFSVFFLSRINRNGQTK